MVPNNNRNEAITRTEYSGFQDAFDFLNQELFGGSLPQLLITLHRRANSKGYFSPDKFAERLGSGVSAAVCARAEGPLDQRRGSG